jgi:regulation of enolase protein 1 (concanavalin A-like superfamily)
MVTRPGTDLWQRTFYGFRKDDAPALLFDCDRDFSFTARAVFQYQALYDQCGLIVCVDAENWIKASVEFENDRFSRLGSVVTNFGYSDWATTDISTPTSMWYRLSRRGADFLVESSPDGDEFRQMRIFHLHALDGALVRFGVYACSPKDSSFEAAFDHLRLEDCLWKAHGEVQT